MSLKHTLAVVMLALIVVTGGAAVATAQQEDPPGEPASFYGSVEDADGTPAPAGTTIVAVAINDSGGTSVEASITVDPEGQYGGGDATDDKLRVDSNAGQEVRFHVGDVDGPQSESTYSLEPGVFEEDLTFPAGAFEAEDGDDGGDDGGDAGGGGGGGGGGGAAPAPEQDVEGDAVADSSFDGRTLSTQVETASAGSSVTSSLDDTTVDENIQNTGASLNSLTATFANDVSNANFDTTYSATNPSEDVPGLSSQTNADEIAYINVDTNVAEDDIESVTFEFSVSQAVLSNLGLEPDRVALYRFNDGEYTELDATVESEGDDRITYTAESPGLSVFAIGAASEQVTATPEPDTATPEPDTPVPEPDTDTAQPDVESPAPPDDGPGAVLIGGVVIVVLAVAVGAYLAFGRE